MSNSLYWIDSHWPGRLAVSLRPRGGEWIKDDVAAWQRIGVKVAVSLLTPEEALELDLDEEQKICSTAGIEFLSFPIIDRSTPADYENFSALVTKLSSRLQEAKTVLIHCRQGIGRSGILAIALLVRAGKGIDDAIQIVTSARGLSVPETAEQLHWVYSLPKRA